MYYNERCEKIVYVNSGNFTGVFDILLAGITYANADYKVERGVTDIYVFEYVTKGKGYIINGDQKIEVNEGDFYCISKESHVVYYSDSKDPYEKMWFNCDGSMVHDIVNTFRFDEVVVKNVNVRSYFIKIHDLLSQMREENSGDTHQKLACLLFNMLAEVSRNDFFAPMKNRISTAESIKNFIDNNVYNNISLDVITNHFGITKMHVIRVFKREFGTTPVQYLIEKKVSIAKSLLAVTVMPIKEISSLLHYSNTQHFSNTFKSATGYSPNKYRQMKQHGTNMLADSDIIFDDIDMTTSDDQQ